MLALRSLSPARLRIGVRSGDLRAVTTLASNPHIKVFPNPSNPITHLLTFLDTTPPDPSIAIGVTSTIPPGPGSFKENRLFSQILNDVLAEHARYDQDLVSQARAFAAPGGMTLGSGGAISPQPKRRRPRGTGDGGAGGASAQGGAGGGGIGGWVHLSDSRNPPDFGRIAWPEDIFGSIEVNGQGEIVGNFQPSGTYRPVTNQGILGLSAFLRERLVERLKKEERRQ